MTLKEVSEFRAEELVRDDKMSITALSKENIGEEAKIIRVLDMAKGPAPIDYISQKSGINNLCGSLEILQQKGLVRRLFYEPYIMCISPQYELTSKAKKLIEQFISSRLEQFLKEFI